MSSANRNVLDLVKSGRSFTYRTNNKGPRTDPCGIPDVTLCQFDSFPFTATFCRLFVMNGRRHLIALQRTEKCCCSVGSVILEMSCHM